MKTLIVPPFNKDYLKERFNNYIGEDEVYQYQNVNNLIIFK